MQNKINYLTVAFACFIFFVSVFSSDGIDRHRKYSPNTLYLFDQPVKGCGYSVLEKDAEGGADGTMEFRWLQKHLLSLIKVCAYETEKQFGSTEFPLLIFDGCAENGDTPVDWEPKPSGRHPGESHDGGINIDLGYYLNSLQGKVFTPDYSACSNHFKNSLNGEIEDSWFCNDRADKLDTQRMAYFYLKMLQLNRSLFSKELLSQIGADCFVKEEILKMLEEWLKEKKYGTDEELLEDFKRIVTCDEFEGWAKSHHHHTHIRLNDVEIYGNLKEAFESLYSMERKINYELLSKIENRKEVLTVKLLSTGLQRALEAEILSEDNIKNVRFKIGEGEWCEPQKGDSRQKVYINLESKISLERTPLKVTTQFVNSEGKLETLTKELVLPKLDPRLFISFDPSQVTTKLSQVGDKLLVKIDYPKISDALITEVYCEIATEKGVSRIDFDKITDSFIIPIDFDRTAIANLCIILCGRKSCRIPLYIKTN